jgi:hypothetical protein
MTLLPQERAELVAVIMIINASHFLMKQLKEDNYLKTKSHRESLWLREGVYIAYCRPKGNDFPHSRQKRSVLEMSLPPVPTL